MEGKGSWIEQLDPSDRERIRKMSEEAVKRLLEREGWKPEQWEGKPLPALKEELAKIWSERRDAELEGAVGGDMPSTDEEERIVEEKTESMGMLRMKLQFEREKNEMQFALEKEKMQIERMRVEAELEAKRLEVQAANNREAEIAELKRQKIKMMEERSRNEIMRMESTVYKAKLFSDALRGTMARMPSDPIEIIPYFRTVERLYDDFRVEPQLKVHLLKPHLTEQARVLIAKMDPNKCANYDEVKKMLLHEFKLSPAALLEKFNSLDRATNETYTLFGNRLMSVLTYYVEHRKVNSLDQLMQLLVCDRIKSNLSHAALQHVLSLENKAEDGWLKLAELVETLDLYYDTHLSSDKPRNVQSAVSNVMAKPSVSKTFQPKFETQGVGNSKNGKQEFSRSNKRCYVCGSASHLAGYHSKLGAQRPGNAGNVGTLRPGNVHNETKPKSVNACITKADNSKSADLPDSVQTETHVKTADVNRVVVTDDVDLKDSPDVLAFVSDVCVQSASAKDNIPDSDLKFATLSYLPVVVSDNEGKCCELDGLSDSGAQVALAKASAIADLDPVELGSVKIKGVIGEPISVPLVRLKVALTDQPERSVSFVCAVTEQANNALILTADIVHRLMPHVELKSNVVQRDGENKDRDDSDDDDRIGDCTENDDLTENSGTVDSSGNDKVVGDGVTTSLVENVIDQGSNVGTSVQPDSSVDSISTKVGYPVGSITDVPSSPEAAALRSEQLTDKTLIGCFSLAKRNKGHFYFKNGVLHRVDIVVGQPVEQLVLPEGRRVQAIDLAHQTFGAHMSYRSTAKRLRYSFWWPTMARDTKSNISRCDRCVRRARITCYDRVPIKSIDRGAVPFNHWWCDIAGPLFPNQRVEYNYCFVACDSFSRWPVAFALRSVNAKSICECLMKIWMTFGVSQFVTMDNASYNTARLTELLLEKMGCSPIFITPGHSEGNTLAERTIGTIKEAIHKVAFDHQRSWYKSVDYILWAMREIPGSSTGVSPWQLAFGYTPRGPCAILKDTWMGSITLPSNLDKPAVQYLQELRDRLAAANEFATTHLKREQSKWANRYNLRSRHKEFSPGESVMILTPDSTASRLWSRWRAPAKIISKQSDYSYLVEIDGARHVIHANKLRKYDVKVNELVCQTPWTPCEFTQVNTCAVVYEKDHEFGPLKYVEGKQISNDLPSLKIDPSKLSHLSDEQRKDLLSVLDKYPECFSETPGFCGQIEHEIVVAPNFQPKRMKAYRVPEKLRPEVDRQINELHELGFIRESKSPMASPLVCVLKKDQTVRCVIDFRYLNKYTLPDALGPPNIADISQRIAKAKYITTFDGKSSYWTIPIKKEHQWLTGFIDGSNRLWEWTRMAFGLKNSGSTFVRMLQNVLYPIRAFVSNYVDDMAVCSEAWKRHLQDIDEYLKTIKESGLTLTLKKSEFAKPEVKFCGSIVGSGVKRVDPDKLAAIRCLSHPETKLQVRQVLGLFGWFREYIPRFAEHALPLTKLTSKQTPNRIPWGDVEQKAFDSLKELLSQATEYKLNAIDWSKPFNVCTDASELAIAGSMSQTDDTGHEQPIMFFSKKLDNTQQKWSTIEREAFAVIEMLKRVRAWVFGYKIHLYSDHNPLSYLTESAPKSAKLMRWSLALQEYDITFHYKEGKSEMMAVPDCLTRV